MLAYNGLALITEKLQAQRLEEATTSVITTNNNIGLSSGAATPGCCSTASKPPVMSSEPSPRTSAQSNLAVKGKNVWALSLETERNVRGSDSVPDVVKTRSQTLHQQLSICRHRKPRHSCQSCCDIHHATPTLAPPKKKHCRSLSVPPPTVDAALPSSSSHAKIWRPIAVAPLNSSSSNNNNPGSSILEHFHNTTMAVPCGNSATSSSIFDKNNKLSAKDSFSNSIPLQHPQPTFSSPTSQNYKWLPKLQPSTSFMDPLRSSVPSPPSVDSGHCTDFTPSDLATPPGSPVPRPASAISSSDISSFSSLSSPWLESCNSRSQRVRVLENRSLSLEDRISGPAPSLSHAASFHSASCIDPCSRRSSSSRFSCMEEASCSSGAIPRCHSQPCVLHSRRYGKKRRRDCDNNRPTLNFNKMTETAYTRSHRRSEPLSTATHHIQTRSLGQPDLHDVLTSEISGSRAAFCLNPIASSPLDPPSLDMAASVALPLTPPEQLSPALPPQQWGEDDDTGDVDGDCRCRDMRVDDNISLFPMNDLDLDQIENH